MTMKPANMNLRVMVLAELLFLALAATVAVIATNPLNRVKK
jgi:hypothetical protein